MEDPTFGSSKGPQCSGVKTLIRVNRVPECLPEKVEKELPHLVLKESSQVRGKGL